MMHKINFINQEKKPNRNCGECTKCCEGYLLGEAYGHKFGNGKICYFLSKGKCSIYPNHPKEPCKDYHCHWLDNLEIPEHIRPDKSNILMTHKFDNSFNYIQVLETGKKIDSEILAQVISFFLLKGQNVECQVNGKYYYYGSTEFMMTSLEREIK